MRLVFDDDAAYSHFQFYWFALTRSQVDLRGIARLETEARLKIRLGAKSSESSFADGGRVLREPCEIDLAADEAVALIECMAATSWTPAAVPHVIAAMRFLGAKVTRTRTLLPGNYDRGTMDADRGRLEHLRPPADAGLLK